MNTANPTPSERYWLCPLYSFDSYSESVDLAEGIHIKTAPNELRKHINEQTRFPNYGQWDDPSDVKWMTLLPYHASAKGTSNRHELIQIGVKEQRRASDLLVDLITAFRLRHEGKIIGGPLMSSAIQNSEWSIGGSTDWTYISKKDFLRKKPEYKLNQTDIPEVNKLVENLSKLRKTGKFDSIGIALRRFNSAYHGEPEDRLIDQMIAFESLYIGDERGIKNKLASRTASLLGESQILREQIINDMKEVYQKRCDIVHVIKEVTDAATQVI